MKNNNIMSEQINAIGEALCKAQATIEHVSKDKQGYGYKYADLAGCLDAIKKPLSDNGLSISQLVAQDENGKQILISLLIHSSGQWLKSIFNIESITTKQGNILQNMGAGLTYVRRYAVCAIVGLTQVDDDAASISKNVNIEAKVEANPVLHLVNLCKEHRLDAKEFAVFHNINSNDIHNVKKSISDFAALKASFLESKISKNDA